LSSNSPEEEEDAGEVHETENWDGPLLQMEQKFRPLARYLQSYLLTPVKHTAPYTQKSTTGLQKRANLFYKKAAKIHSKNGGFSKSSNCFLFHIFLHLPITASTPSFTSIKYTLAFFLS